MNTTKLKINESEWHWPLNKSKWWNDAVGLLQSPAKTQDKNDLAVFMLRAACYANCWPPDGHEAARMASALSELGTAKISSDMVMYVAAGGPPTIDVLMRVGVMVAADDYEVSLPPQTKQLDQKHTDTLSRTIKDRYKGMGAINDGWATQPNVLIQFAKQLGFTTYHVAVINVISNAKPDAPIDQKWIAEQSLCSLPTVKRIISDLKGAGFLKVTRGHQMFDACTYDLSGLWQKLDDLWHASKSRAD